MNTDVDHKTTCALRAEAATIVTLGEMRALIQASDAIPADRKAYLCWALNRTTTLIGNGVADVRADPKTVLRQLDQLSPAMAGLSPRSFSNLKTLLRASFRMFAPRLSPARSRVKLKGPWAALEALLPVRLKRNLSRFMRYAQSMRWAPQDIDEQHIEQFAHYVENEAMLLRPEGVVRATRHGWNHAADSVPAWPHRRVAPPPCKRIPYWLKPHELSASLRQEIDEYLHRLAQPDPFLAQSSKPLHPTTITQNRHYLILLASALARSGFLVEEITSIAVLVRPDNVKSALRFLFNRAGGRMTVQIEMLAYHARKFAVHAGLPDEDLARLVELQASIARAYPSRRGLTAKNRALLERMDDAAFADRLIMLPSRLMAAARQMTASAVAMSSARDAVATEILITCSMRVGNLIDLRLGKTIRKYGEGAKAHWVIDVPGEKVKNGQPLRYTLLPESARLIEEYLENWHHRWCGHGAAWLFQPRTVVTSIARFCRRPSPGERAGTSACESPRISFGT